MAWTFTSPEPIPPEGYLRLDTCSFDSGNCSWYDSDLNTAASADSSSLGRREHNQNTESHDSGGAKQRYGWEEAELAKPEDDYIYIRHGDKPPYAPTGECVSSRHLIIVVIKRKKMVLIAKTKRLSVSSGDWASENKYNSRESETKY